MIYNYSLRVIHIPAMSEVEETIKRIQSHKGVIGIIVVSQDGKTLYISTTSFAYPTLVRHSYHVFLPFEAHELLYRDLLENL